MSVDKLTFNPSDSVTYTADNTKQLVQLTITNSGSQTITFKMKSTRPGRYKMRPVYGKVAAGDHTNVQLIYKGAKPGTNVPMKDHFSCIYTLCNSSISDVKKIWKHRKYLREIATQSTRKHKWRILYKGYNDQLADVPLADNDCQTARDGKSTKTKGPDEEDEKPAAAAAAVAAAGGAGSKDCVQLMFREQACPLSDSGSDSEEQEDDEKKEKKKGDQQKP